MTNSARMNLWFWLLVIAGFVHQVMDDRTSAAVYLSAAAIISALAPRSEE